MKSSVYILIMILMIPFSNSRGQNTNSTATGDSLNLSAIINEAVNNYPSVNKAKVEIEAADARIGLAKSAYLPDVNFTSSYSRLGPAQSITIPNMGTFQLYPVDNYSANLNYSQIIYDFGKTAKSVSLELQNKDLAKLSIEQVKQRLSLALASNYYSLVFLQDAVKIKDEELATLNEHLNFVEKNVATGSATQYDILSTKVRISSIENQKTDILTSLRVLQCQLNMYLGKPEKASLLVKKELLNEQVLPQIDSLLEFAFANRDEMKIVRQKSAIAESKLKLVGAQNNPVFSFSASGGYKNGYLPELNNLKANFVLGVGVKIPVFDATRAKYNALQVNADRKGIGQDAELARRTIIDDVTECYANLEASVKKVAQSELQLKQATEANKLAQTSYNSGVITNLDLLDSNTSLSESKLLLLKSQIDYSLNLIKLKTVVGERLY
jgi:outer membrane protein